MPTKKHAWGKIEYHDKAKHEDTRAGGKTESEKKTAERRTTEEHPEKKTDTR
ncbi:hypothetical protein [Streptomyces sp. Da 82-17]|uniref:hypothetical protein n=1 Tax=Streptomyces sp. Da 82-17 TaxID=3377116 RepID=UPI0038D50DE4